MDAGAEGKMPIRLTADVEPVGIGELRGIAIGGADADMDISAGFHCYPAENGIALGAAIAKLVRTLRAQELLDGRIDEFRVRAQIGERLGMADQEIDAVADEICCGLVAGIQEENAVVDEFELAKPFAGRRVRVELAAADQRGEHFAGAAAAAFFASDMMAQIRLEFLDGAHAGVELLRA